MCLASKYIGELESLSQRIKNDFEVLRKKLSDQDKLISEKYHIIECANFNACEGYYLAKELQELLRQRRVIKDELNRMNTLSISLKAQKLDSNLNKTKGNIKKAKQKNSEYKEDWKYTYRIEDLLNGARELVQLPVN